MILDPKVDSGYDLIHNGIIALSKVEANGIRMDVKYMDATIESLTKKISGYNSKVRMSTVGKLWQKRFGLKTNYGSNDQLAAILFTPKAQGGLGYISEVKTDSGKPSTEEDVLIKLNSKFIHNYLKIGKYEKVLADMKGLRRETYGERLHCSYNLHTAKTYRSSAQDPNFQNQQAHNKEMAQLIRDSFIASEGCVLVENDFKGAEVLVGACYHKDPVMMEYIQDETKDMHRDMAMQLFKLTPKDWAKLKEMKAEKAIRQSTKSRFVFAEFYGDWFMHCGELLWEEMERMGLKGPNGNTLKEHLAEKGITELGNVTRDESGGFNSPEEGTFLKHVQEVEHDFWNNRFKVYGAWKKKWFAQYEERGWFDTYTGFHIHGYFQRNQVNNSPVQGSAFHCLLWSLIRLQKELRQKKMKTKIVGQIHDSIIADVPIDEIDEYLAIVKRITAIDIRKEYKWLIIPLVIECEISPIGKSWYHKQEVKYKEDGSFENKDGTFKGTARQLLEFWKK